MNDRVAYSYSVLRYVHDTLTGEFVNVGLIMYSPQKSFAKFVTKSTFSRITGVFPTVDIDDFKLLTNSLKKRFKYVYEKKIANCDLWDKQCSLGEILSDMIPKDDSSLLWSPISHGVSSNLEMDFEKIFSRQITKFDIKRGSKRKTDSDVWRSFKRDLEKRNLQGFFQEKTINGRDDSVDFPFAWKNGVWHCVEPVSFDLSAPDYIKDKAHKLLGQLASVNQDSSENFKVYMILAEPQSSSLSSAFKSAVSILKKVPVENEIYFEGEISALLDKLGCQIGDHSAGVH